MNAAEYTNIEALERTHWYYVGKRELVRYWIEKTFPLHRDCTLLDCGAGTGFFAKEMETDCRVLVLDDHEEALRSLRMKFSAEQVLRVSATGIPLLNGSVDVVTALDVLEHIKNDAAAVGEIHRVLKSGGILVATVPASMALWSDWDESLHHFRRYDLRSFIALFPSDLWTLVHANYTNVPVYPVVWLLRKWRRISKRRVVQRTDLERRSEDQVPPRWLNQMLRMIFVRLGRSRIRFPVGVSLLLVAQRR